MWSRIRPDALIAATFEWPKTTSLARMPLFSGGYVQIFRRRDYGADTATICLPVLPPLSMLMNAPGAFSIPARDFVHVACTQLALTPE